MNSNLYLLRHMSGYYVRYPQFDSSTLRLLFCQGYTDVDRGNGFESIETLLRTDYSERKGDVTAC